LSFRALGNFPEFPTSDGPRSHVSVEPMPALSTALPGATRGVCARPVFVASRSPAWDESLQQDISVSLRMVTATAMEGQPIPLNLGADEKRAADADAPIGIIGGGVSGIFAALTLRSLGYTNVTIFEADARVGGKAGSFDHGGKSFPIGAVSTPFALKESSFTGAQIFERPLRFVASVLSHSASRLQILVRGEQGVRITPWHQKGFCVTFARTKLGLAHTVRITHGISAFIPCLIHNHAMFLAVSLYTAPPEL